MRKVITIMLAMVMLFAITVFIVGCGNGELVVETPTATPTPTAEPTPTTEPIATPSPTPEPTPEPEPENDFSEQIDEYKALWTVLADEVVGTFQMGVSMGVDEGVISRLWEKHASPNEHRRELAQEFEHEEIEAHILEILDDTTYNQLEELLGELRNNLSNDEITRIVTYIEGYISTVEGLPRGALWDLHGLMIMNTD